MTRRDDLGQKTNKIMLVPKRNSGSEISSNRRHVTRHLNDATMASQKAVQFELECIHEESEEDFSQLNGNLTMRKMDSEPPIKITLDDDKRKLSDSQRKMALQKFQKVSKSTKLLSKTPAPTFTCRLAKESLKRQPKLNRDLKMEPLLVKTTDDLPRFHMSFI